MRGNGKRPETRHGHKRPKQMRIHSISVTDAPTRKSRLSDVEPTNTMEP
ncbi:hypothetical protein JOD27_002043 [Lentzea nigeriaca]|nr:hypothetical protein [Lentzea nigeriaca]